MREKFCIENNPNTINLKSDTTNIDNIHNNSIYQIKLYTPYKNNTPIITTATSYLLPQKPFAKQFQTSVSHLNKSQTILLKCMYYVCVLLCIF